MTIDSDTVRRLHARGKTDRQIADAMGLPRRSVAQVRMRMGLAVNPGRICFHWSSDRIRFLLSKYGTMTASAIAKQLGCSTKSIYQAADRFGLSAKRPRLEKRPGLTRRVRQLHSRGFSDIEIAEDIGVDPHGIGRLRAHLGLASNAHSLRQRDKTRRTTARQCRKAGVRSLGELRAKALKQYAIDRGWPADLKKRQVQILELIWQRGPMTREEIGRALGMRLRRRPNGRYWYPMMCNTANGRGATSYTGDLINRGLLITLGRIVQNRPPGAKNGQGHNTVLYSLPLDISKAAPKTETRNGTDG